MKHPIIKLAFISMLVCIPLLFIQVYPVSAANYIQGTAKYNDLVQTPEFSLTVGKKILDLSKQATKDASFEIQLTNTKGEVVDTCLGDAYTFKTKGKCYFNSPAEGKYYLTFISFDTTSTITMKYRLYDEFISK